MIRQIYCKNSHNFIGNGGELLYSIPEDLKYFKEMTLGSVVLMGRLTWLSLPDKYKPLPGRVNVVLANDTFQDPKADAIFQNITAALDAYKDRDIWIIGGGKLLETTRHLADSIHVTDVIDGASGDTIVNEIDPLVHELMSISEVMTHNDLSYTRKIYSKYTMGA